MHCAIQDFAGNNSGGGAATSTALYYVERGLEKSSIFVAACELAEERVGAHGWRSRESHH